MRWDALWCYGQKRSHYGSLTLYTTCAGHKLHTTSAVNPCHFLTGADHAQTCIPVAMVMKYYKLRIGMHDMQKNIVSRLKLLLIFIIKLKWNEMSNMSLYVLWMWLVGQGISIATKCYQWTTFYLYIKKCSSCHLDYGTWPCCSFDYVAWINFAAQ